MFSCLYPDTYPEPATSSRRPDIPCPFPESSKRSLCDPVYFEVSVNLETDSAALAFD